MKKLLYLNACVNRNTSRTYQISQALVKLLNKNNDFEVQELVLENENIPVLSTDILNERLKLLETDNFSDETFNYANQFKIADCIVISAPYWNFGFPAILKTYIEAISVTGIVFQYNDIGYPIGLCQANTLYYVTTRGGYIGDENDLGLATIKSIASQYGIKNVICISIDGLDIVGCNQKALLESNLNSLNKKIKSSI